MLNQLPIMASKTSGKSKCCT